ncbi:Kef-type potassium/proton antiporter, CPA2 family [Ferrimonas sediminum]|uniref:Kef-type potassium/proton antiporter, CPA2 family n=1 Tax=Ferrimonas sediminum TaxID=718193 RepID=A0A1G8N4X2_9GAMM|nr:monovalent cation:proton antiporter-2 (CPA2) family protein [Ferrimonas sediminum]SDI75244.1 Kef-type potassium/proton antiporter, CPA2 family [Ferrimonas sediminum]
MTTYFLQAFIYLLAAVIAVPIAKKLGLGSVLGYLVAGVVIGPLWGLVGEETATIQHFAEFGVVMMLFVVGLELEPRMLWEMRHRLLGLGGLQVALTATAMTALGLYFQLAWQTALAIGFIFSLSSTAIVLQTFNEKSLGRTEGGRSAFSVLLFQDIAVIPMLALIPLLALPELQQAAEGLAQAADHHDLSLVAGLPGWAYALVVLATIIGLVAAGHYFSRPLFRFVADSGLREIFTATALLLVIGIAALMGLLGLSPALGAFLAGVVLANSEFRHELESNIEPFKGLLLGLFFITVGAGINFSVLAGQLGTVLALTLAVIVIKLLVLYLLGLVFRIRGSDRWLFALSLAQAGEFGFVLLGYSQQQHVITPALGQMLSLVVALSMFLTPGLFILYDKLILPRYQRRSNDPEADEIDEQGTVIIAGIGRFGQIINRMLIANGIKTVVLDHNASQVEILRSVNIKSYFGDATRPDLLHTAGIEQASLLVVALDEKERSVELVQYVKRHYPKVKVFARGYDRGHVYALRSVGVDYVIKETMQSALTLASEAMIALGGHPFRVRQRRAVYEALDREHDKLLYESWLQSSEEDRFGTHYRELFMQLEELLAKAMQGEGNDRHSRAERSWTPPPKGYADNLKPSGSEPD